MEKLNGDGLSIHSGMMSSPRSVLMLFLAVQLSAGLVGFVAVRSLLQVSVVSPCQAVTWPFASTQVRLSCAQIMAQKGDLESLKQAIALVVGTAASHPLSPQTRQFIHQVQAKMLSVAEREFQQGNLTAAIHQAQQVKTSGATRRIQHWRSLWQQATEVEQGVHSALLSGNIPLAFSLNLKLRSLDNDYWRQVRYERLTLEILAAQRDIQTLSQAKQTARTGTVPGLLAAMTQVRHIGPQSKSYPRAQRALNDWARQLLEIAVGQLDQGHLQAAQSLVQGLPPEVKLVAEVEDFNVLAAAQTQAISQNRESLERAIMLVGRLGPDRPLYPVIRSRLRDWQAQLTDLHQWETARSYALEEGVAGLYKAIELATKVPKSSPYNPEVETDIRQWQEEIAIIETQPLFEQADELASGGALEGAIWVMQQIPSTHPLYPQAVERIKVWQLETSYFVSTS